MLDNDTMSKLVCFEINEINFPDIEKYIQEGKLKNFKMLFEKYGYTTTISESDQGILNPWVQWVTVHTGLEYADHQVKRLGDAQGKDFKQIWESVEEKGYKVGAFYPFNTKNSLKAPAFFTPDPWVNTPMKAPFFVRLIDSALKQVTNDYAKDKITLSSYLKLAVGVLPYARFKHYGQYLSFSYHYLMGRKWYRALFLDLLMSDVFLKLYRQNSPDMATACVNAGAHIQHHYAFSSKHYDGNSKNPEWYVPAGFDPVAQIYELYDQLIGEWIAELGDQTRIMLMTGLSQEAHDRMSIYYRLNDHVDFLNKIGLEYKEVQPLMTEDFLLWFETEAQALVAQKLLEAVVAVDEKALFFVESADSNTRTDDTTDSIFYVDNRGKDLYVQLRPGNCVYPESFKIQSGDVVIAGFEKEVSFVSIKNSGHKSEGYFIDTGATKIEGKPTMPLKDVFQRMLEVFSDRAKA